MAKKNYYAVRKGNRTGIFRTWEECKACVHGFSGAEYKGFAAEEEARAYLGITGAEEKCIDMGAEKKSPKEPADVELKEKTLKNFADAGVKKKIPKEPTDAGAEEKTSKEPADAGMAGHPERAVQESRSSIGVEIYVDGSYVPGKKEFSYGMVILQDGEEHRYSKKIEDEELAKMHNVAGEIKGAEAAMQYAMDHGLEHIIIYHDYEGIAKWCTGEWRAKKAATQAYREFYNLARKKIKIEFVKVEGHSNNKYNDIADELAKEALGL